MISWLMFVDRLPVDRVALGVGLLGEHGLEALLDRRVDAAPDVTSVALSPSSSPPPHPAAAKVVARAVTARTTERRRAVDRMLSPLGAGLSQAFRPVIRWRSVTCTTAESNQPDPCRRRMPCQATVRSRRAGSRWADESALDTFQCARDSEDGEDGRAGDVIGATRHADRRRDARRRLDDDGVVHPQRPLRADADLLRDRAPGARGGRGAGLPAEPQRPDPAHGQHRDDRPHLRLPGRRPRLEPDAPRRRALRPARPTTC